MKHTVLLGAFDRYNYGDILFPKVLEHEIRKQYSENEMKLTFCGLIEADLTAVGGYETQAISKVLEEEHIDNIIIVGGDVLGASMSSMLSNLKKGFSKYFWSYSWLLCRKLKFPLGQKLIDKLAGYFLHIHSEHPWLPHRPGTNIFFNAVGGELLSYINYETLKTAKHLSVRDTRTLESIKNNLHIMPLLSPDSAGIMSEIFDITKIDGMHYELTSFIKENLEYICFQCNMPIWGKYQTGIIEEIVKIHQKYGLPLILTPIGYASGHEDHIALKKLSKKISLLGINHYMPNFVLNINEIMYIIAHSKTYLGTSLHGAITCISFGVPVIGISKNIKKLDSYLKTWGGEFYEDGCTHISELFNTFQKIADVKAKKELAYISDNIKSKIYKDISILINKLDYEP